MHQDISYIMINNKIKKYESFIGTLMIKEFKSIKYIYMDDEKYQEQPQKMKIIYYRGN